MPQRLTPSTEELIGRQWLLDDIHRWVDSPDSPPLYEVVGGPGVGKSAVLDAAANDPRLPVAHSFLRDRRRGRLDECSAAEFYRRLAEDLADGEPGLFRRLAESASIRVEQKVDVNSGAVIGVILDASALNDARRLKEQLVLPLLGRIPRRLLIIIDALDEIAEAERWRADGVRLIPEIESLAYSGHENLRLLVASRLESPLNLPKALRRRACLDSDGPTDVARPAGFDDIRSFALARLGRESQETAAAVSQASEGNFLFARYLVEALKAGYTIESATAVPSGLEEWYALDWRRLRDTWADPRAWAEAEAALGVLAAARGTGLTLSQLREITGIPDSRARGLISECGPYLSGTAEDSLRLYHQSFAEFIFKNTAVSKADSEFAIAGSFAESVDDWTEADAAYAARSATAHLRSSALAATRAELRSIAGVFEQLLTAWPYLEKRVELSGPAGLLEDIGAYRELGRRVRPNGPAPNLVAEVVDTLEAELPRLAGAVLRHERFVQQIHNRAVMRGARLAASHAADRQRMLGLRWLVATTVLHTESGAEDGPTRVRSWQVHPGGVRSLDWSAQTGLASAGDDGAVVLVDSVTGAVTRGCVMHGSGVRQVRWSPAGDTLASCADDGQIRVWCGPDGKDFVHSGQLTLTWALGWSKRGTFLASGDDSGLLSLWLEPGRSDSRVTGRHATMIRSIAWLSDDTMVSADRDGWVKLWKAPDFIEIRAVRIHAAAIRGMEVSGDGMRLATASRDGTAVVWSCEFERIHTFRSSNPGVGARTVRWSAVGRLAIGWWDGSVDVYDPDGCLLAGLQTDGDSIRSLGWVGEDQLAIGTRDGHILLWPLDMHPRVDLNRGRLSGARLATDGGSLFVECADGRSIALSISVAGIAQGSAIPLLASTDNRLLRAQATLKLPGSPRLSAAAADTVILLEEVGSASDTAATPRRLSGHGDWVRALRFAPDAKVLASGSDDNAVMIWDMGTGEPTHRLPGHDRGVRCLAWSQDGSLLASGGADGHVLVWDRSGRHLWTFDGRGGEVLCLAWSVDGAQLVCGTAGGWLYVIDGAGEPDLAARLPGGVNDVVVGADGELLCATDIGVGVRLMAAQR
jgi:WD40 repeat protein